MIAYCGQTRSPALITELEALGVGEWTQRGELRPRRSRWFDIGMRMLVARELFRAQGLPDSYRIDPVGPNGKPLTKTGQIRMCGNAVPPQPVAAIVRAQFLETA